MKERTFNCPLAPICPKADQPAYKNHCPTTNKFVTCIQGTVILPQEKIEIAKELPKKDPIYLPSGRVACEPIWESEIREQNERRM